MTTTRWEGATLVSEGTRKTSAGASSVVDEVREVFSISTDDGRTLTIEVTTTVAGAKTASSLLYKRTKDIGSCQSWPTPCKSPS
jgi:hypothetical protein